MTVDHVVAQFNSAVVVGRRCDGVSAIAIVNHDTMGSRQASHRHNITINIRKPCQQIGGADYVSRVFGGIGQCDSCAGQCGGIIDRVQNQTAGGS